MFFGTPHQGGQGVAIGELLARLGSLVTYTSSNVMRHLAHNSEWLQLQQMQYSDIADDFETKFFYETYKMPVAPTINVLVSKSYYSDDFTLMCVQIVPKYSAVMPGLARSEEIGLEANHKTMVKFTAEEDANYQKVIRRLMTMTKRAEAKVTENWARWEKQRMISSYGMRIS